jgi:hypothetical protein
MATMATAVAGMTTKAIRATTVIAATAAVTAMATIDRRD